VDRVGYKEQIKHTATQYICLLAKTFNLKNNIINEIDKAKPNMALVTKKKEELKNVVLRRIMTKKKFVSVLQ
jgi:hypothetical protein